jgi:hypothetical protein
VPGGSAALQKD